MEAEIMKVYEKKYIATASGAVSENKYNYEYALPTLDVVR